MATTHIGGVVEYVASPLFTRWPFATTKRYAPLILSLLTYQAHGPRAPNTSFLVQEKD